MLCRNNHSFLLLSTIIINKLITYYKSHSVTKIAYCKVYNEKDGKLFLKQIPGTFDPEEYGTSVFLIAEPKIVDQLEQLSKQADVSLDGDMIITMLYNSLRDIQKREDGVYIRIRSLKSVQKSNYTYPS